MRNLWQKKRLWAIMIVVFISMFLILMVKGIPTLVFAHAESDPPIFTSRENASEYFYDQMINHREKITFIYVTDQSDGSEVSKYFKEDAFTDYPENSSLLGDYVRYNLYNGYRLKYSYTLNQGKYYYTFNYEMSYRSTQEQDLQFESALSSTMESLNLRGKSAIQKANKVYKYVCNNVAYDYKHKATYFQKYTAYAALIRKTSVCQGYANLFYRMCKEAGIPVRIITGTSKGQSHAWNIVGINGKYYNVDATWDAGMEKPLYFLKTNKEFRDHKRNAEYTTADFNRQQPMARSSYCAISTIEPKLTIKTMGQSTKLSWSACHGASGYSVYRGTKPAGPYKKVASVSKNTTHYLSKGLFTNKSYYYHIRAYQTVNNQRIYSKASISKQSRR